MGVVKFHAHKLIVIDDMDHVVLLPWLVAVQYHFCVFIHGHYIFIILEMNLTDVWSGIKEEIIHLLYIAQSFITYYDYFFSGNDPVAHKNGQLIGTQ
ncbi:hypothetical protein ACJX0J_012575, partial [Zea mays]